MEIEACRRIFDILRLFPKEKNELSYLDVIGKPADENIVSNLLAFFIDSGQQHGFGTLLAKAFLRLCKCDEIPSEAWAYREYYTLKGKRIDIVIETNISHIVCIENKIYAALNNPLDDYQRTMEQHYSGKTIHYFILAPYPIQTDKNNWQSITYNQLWSEVKKEYGYHLSSSNQKWNCLLASLIEHTDKMTAHNNFSLSSKEKYMLEHYNEIQEIIKEQNNLCKKIDNFANSIYADIKETVENDNSLSSLINCWQCSMCYVFDFNKHHCAVDFELNAHQILMSWFNRNDAGKDTYNAVSQLLLQEHPEFSVHGERLFLIEIRRVTDDTLSENKIAELKETVLFYLSLIVNILQQIDKSKR